MIFLIYKYRYGGVVLGMNDHYKTAPADEILFYIAWYKPVSYCLKPKLEMGKKGSFELSTGQL